MNPKSILRIVLGAAVALSVGVFALQPVQAEPIVADPMLISWEPANCTLESSCTAEDQHKVIKLWGGTFLAGSEHPCMTPPNHAGPLCEGLAFAPQQVLDANPKLLAEMLSSPETNVRFNADRGAIQVLDCNENVVLHLPTAVVAAL